MQRALAAVVAVCAIGCHATPTPAAPAAATADRADAAADDSGDDPEDGNDQLPTITPATATASASAQTGGAALLAEAQRELSAVRASHYVHHTVVDESTGMFDFDCSGFVDYALSRSAPDAFGAIQAQSQRRPLAKHFEAVFAGAPTSVPPATVGAAGSPRWTRVEHARDLAPGDLIAWLEPPEKHSRNTGHVMIAASAPTAGARAGEWTLAVIDSSHSGHGKRDARVREHRNGLGTGEIVLIVDGDDHPVGYRWSTWAKSKPYRTAIGLGRLR